MAFDKIRDDNEAYSRQKIDTKLRDVGWRLVDSADARRNVRLEQMTDAGREDYPLLDSKNFPLCVIEAKKPSVNPLSAKDQARRYAESQNIRFITDPRTGEVKEINVNARRLETIYQTNMRTAEARARYDEMRELSASVYWRYMTQGDDSVRSEHAAWHGKVLHRDDPWWQTHYPPNSWGCRCYVLAYSLEECLKNGWDVKIGGKDMPPGEPHPDWAYNPGAKPKVAALSKIDVDASFNNFPIARKLDEYKPVFSVFLSR